jgi:hypothetical protein
MTVTGANIIRLTTDDGMEFDPAWRPSGNWSIMKGIKKQ